MTSRLVFTDGDWDCCFCLSEAEAMQHLVADFELARRLGGSLNLHLQLAADCVRNQGGRTVALFVCTTRTLAEETTWIPVAVL